MYTLISNKNVGVRKVVHQTFQTKQVTHAVQYVT